MLTRQRARRTAGRAGARAATRSSRRCRPASRAHDDAARARCAGRRSGSGPCRLPTCVCSSSLDADRRSRSSGLQSDGQAVAHERLAQRVLAARRRRRLGIGRDALAHDLLGDLERRARRGRARTSASASSRASTTSRDELLGEREPVDDGRLGLRAMPVDVAGLEALLARGLRRSPRPARARPRSARRPARAARSRNWFRPAEAARAGRAAAGRAACRRRGRPAAVTAASRRVPAACARAMIGRSGTRPRPRARRRCRRCRARS